MAIQVSEWLVTSDLVDEAAFRIDVPGPDRGTWILSYLPTHRRLSRDQALVGVRLAELILSEFVSLNSESDLLVARLYAEELELELTDAMCLLALRGGEFRASEFESRNCVAQQVIR
ncbi:hypothetical protein GPX89_40735 [Nocardia sp. ET3-3]|uniref:Uncharacterized protein n=1 Tax=Nocardia terrae TaxID=2675851 RepID=A0A7K1VAW1_9NOCA|nr:hypothetical protein [Nocardia terrae]MVU83552.1 hypothetical protein [Nocardia terrae]